MISLVASGTEPTCNFIEKSGQSQVEDERTWRLCGFRAPKHSVGLPTSHAERTQNESVTELSINSGREFKFKSLY
ncbi:hypothetical protein BDZ89DRAFT_1075212 [Hymenopellis radicata]|nr:hypothetical protein BDZ89DRAFT_1075212 [Hymenopellis radicata]